MVHSTLDLQRQSICSKCNDSYHFAHLCTEIMVTMLAHVDNRNRFCLCGSKCSFFFPKESFLIETIILFLTLYRTHYPLQKQSFLTKELTFHGYHGWLVYFLFQKPKNGIRKGTLESCSALIIVVSPVLRQAVLIFFAEIYITQVIVFLISFGNC